MSKLLTDPLAENHYAVLPYLIHKYPNRVLCLLTTACQAHCSFCFRKNLYSQQPMKNNLKIEKIIDYLKRNPNINEFIFSGGEPLLASDLLLKLYEAVSLLPTIKIIRIHSRLPIIAPQKIVWAVLEKISQQQRVNYFVLHVNTPTELNQPATLQAIKKLRQLNFILLSHTVFLKNINDDETTLANLFNALVENGVKPYYIFHCDNMAHTQPYIVDIKKEIAIMTNLRQKLSGLAYPLHVIDSASGQGKIPLPTNFWQYQSEKYLDFHGEENEI